MVDPNADFNDEFAVDKMLLAQQQAFLTKMMQKWL